MYTASDLRKGLKIEIDDEPYIVTQFDFRKPGKGQALYRCKLKNMLNDFTVDKTFRSVDKMKRANLEERTLIYSYPEPPNFVFMDGETYAEIRISESIVGKGKYFLVENTECQVLFFRDRPIEISLPTFVDKEVAKTEPGARGDTATNVTKPAWLENGFEFQIPLFVNRGDRVRIDTRTGEYVERVNKA